MSDNGDCTETCRRVVTCVVCYRRKPPTGRDVAPAMSGGYCEHECPGSRIPPWPGHLWPSELIGEERVTEDDE